MTRRRRLVLVGAGITVLVAAVVAAFLLGGGPDRTGVQQSIADAQTQTESLRTLSAAADATPGQLATGGLFGLAIGAAVGGVVTYRYYDSQLT